MMTGRRRLRFSRTPEGRPNSRKGRDSKAARVPICAGVACSISTAQIGRASSVICAPKWARMLLNQKRRKSGLRITESAGTRFCSQLLPNERMVISHRILLNK